MMMLEGSKSCGMSVCMRSACMYLFIALLTVSSHSLGGNCCCCWFFHNLESAVSWKCRRCRLSSIFVILLENFHLKWCCHRYVSGFHLLILLLCCVGPFILSLNDFSFFIYAVCKRAYPPHISRVLPFFLLLLFCWWLSHVFIWRYGRKAIYCLLKFYRNGIACVENGKFKVVGKNQS